MDISFISAAVTAMTAAKELGKAALNVRNFNEIAPVITNLNDQLLKAQEALFIHNSQLLNLQQEQFETTKKLRELEEALAERGRYSLFEMADRVFVYRVNIPPVSGNVSDPISSNPMHYICQSCFDKGIKSVLQGIRYLNKAPHALKCSICGGLFPLS